jgi:hypothetical protein
LHSAHHVLLLAVLPHHTLSGRRVGGADAGGLAAEAAYGIREILRHDIVVGELRLGILQDFAGNAVAFVEIAGGKEFSGRYDGPGDGEAVQRVADYSFDADIFMHGLSEW